MTNPKLPEKIEGYRSGEINALIDYAAAMTLLDGVDIVHDRTERGVRPILLRSGKAKDNSNPNSSFWTTLTGNLAFQVAPGKLYVDGILTTIADLTFDTDIDITGHYAAKSYAYLKLDITDPAAVTAAFELWSSLKPDTAVLKYFMLLEMEITADVITNFIRRWIGGDIWYSGGFIGDPGATDPGTEIDTLPASNPGAEGTKTAQTDTWTANNESNHGLKQWFVSRIFYDHGDECILYMFMRYQLFDKQGRLYYVSAETRVTIDEAVPETV